MNMINPETVKPGDKVRFNAERFGHPNPTGLTPGAVYTVNVVAPRGGFDSGVIIGLAHHASEWDPQFGYEWFDEVDEVDEVDELRAQVARLEAELGNSRVELQRVNDQLADLQRGCESSDPRHGSLFIDGSGSSLSHWVYNAYVDGWVCFYLDGDDVQHSLNSRSIGTAFRGFDEGVAKLIHAFGIRVK